MSDTAAAPVAEQAVEVDNSNELIPGTKITYAQAEKHGIPDNLVRIIPHMAEQSKPRKLGIIESNGDWYLYRSVSRKEFKVWVGEATQRAVKTAQAAQKDNKDVNVAQINADSTSYLEERVASQCCLFPQLNMAKMGDYDAGVPKLIHDAVLQRSNFEQTSEPIAL